MSKIEKDWIYKDLRCLVIFVGYDDISPLRHRCGYVQVPNDHPFYEKHYNDKIFELEVNINKQIQEEGPTFDESIAILFGDKSYLQTMCGHISIHGGVTYSGKLSHESTQGWWIGFDCCHCDDIENPEYSMWQYRKMRATNETLSNDEFDKLFHPDNRMGHFWTLEETIIEVEKLADQLSAIYQRVKEGELILKKGY